MDLILTSMMSPLDIQELIAMKLRTTSQPPRFTQTHQIPQASSRAPVHPSNADFSAVSDYYTQAVERTPPIPPVPLVTETTGPIVLGAIETNSHIVLGATKCMPLDDDHNDDDHNDDDHNDDDHNDDDHSMESECHEAFEEDELLDAKATQDHRIFAAETSQPPVYYRPPPALYVQQVPTVSETSDPRTRVAFSTTLFGTTGRVHESLGHRGPSIVELPDDE